MSRGSILTGSNILFSINFLFSCSKASYAILSLLPTLCIMGKLEGNIAIYNVSIREFHWTKRLQKSMGIFLIDFGIFGHSLPQTVNG